MSNNSESLSQKEWQVILYTGIFSIFTSIISSIIAAYIIGEGRFSSITPPIIQLGIFVLSITIILATIFVAVVRRTLLKLVRAILRGITVLLGWLVSNWQLTVGILLLVTASLLVYLYTKALWSFTIVGLFYLANLLSSLWVYKKRPVNMNAGEVRYKAISLVPGIGNKHAKAFFRNLPNEILRIGSIGFRLESDSLILDTGAKGRYFNLPNGTRVFEHRLLEPERNIVCVHLLINSGNSRKIWKWFTIGEVKLVFKNGDSQITSLILGNNIREWAIGNNPVNYVDSRDDENSQVAWKGKTSENKYAVIDHLKIPVDAKNRSNELTSIEFHHTNNQVADPANVVQLLVFAITLEYE